MTEQGPRQGQSSPRVQQQQPRWSQQESATSKAGGGRNGPAGRAAGARSPGEAGEVQRPQSGKVVGTRVPGHGRHNMETVEDHVVVQADRSRHHDSRASLVIAGDSSGLFDAAAKPYEPGARANGSTGLVARGMVRRVESAAASSVQLGAQVLDKAIEQTAAGGDRYAPTVGQTAGHDS